MHELSYCFPVKKLSLVQINDYNSVYSEYLKTNYSLTDLSLNNDEFDEVVLSTIEAALLRKQNLKHFNLEIMNLTYSSLKLLSLPYVRAINWDSGFSRSYVNSAYGVDKECRFRGTREVSSVVSALNTFKI